MIGFYSANPQKKDAATIQAAGVVTEVALPTIVEGTDLKSARSDQKLYLQTVEKADYFQGFYLFPL